MNQPIFLHTVSFPRPLTLKVTSYVDLIKQQRFSKRNWELIRVFSSAVVLLYFTSQDNYITLKIFLLSNRRIYCLYLIKIPFNLKVPLVNLLLQVNKSLKNKIKNIMMFTITFPKINLFNKPLFPLLLISGKLYIKPIRLEGSLQTLRIYGSHFRNMNWKGHSRFPTIFFASLVKLSSILSNHFNSP